MSILLPGEREPDYGRVQELCHTLGFGRDTNKARGYEALTRKTILFRKDFVKRNRLAVFPLRYDDPIVRTCVSEFYDVHEQLFRFDVSQSRGTPLPEKEKELILDTVAKLMCTQEIMFRRNDEYLKKKRNQDYPQDNSESELEVAQDQEILDGEETIRVISDLPQPQKVAGSSEGDATGSKRSIERHLEYTYPTGEAYETSSSDWLFDSEQILWPNSEQAFAFRYFHERNLYTASKQNTKQVHRFARVLQKRLGIENDHARDIIVRSKCKQLIKEISISWGPGDRGTAFLIKTPNGHGYVKSSQFERAWKFHRKLWIEKVHGGKTEGVVELNQAPTPPIELEDASRKRLHEIDQAPTTTVPPTNAGRSPKRVRQSGPQLPLEQRSGTAMPQQPSQTVAPESQAETLLNRHSLSSHPLPEQQKQSASSAMAVDVSSAGFANNQDTQSSSKMPAQKTAPQPQAGQTSKQNAEPVSEDHTNAPKRPVDRQISQPASNATFASSPKQPQHKNDPTKATDRRKSQPSLKEATPDVTQSVPTSLQHPQLNATEPTPIVPLQDPVVEKQNAQNQVPLTKENAVASQPQVERAPGAQHHPLPKKSESAVAPEPREQSSNAQSSTFPKIAEGASVPLPGQPPNVQPEASITQQNATAPQARIERPPMVQTQAVQEKIDDMVAQAAKPQSSTPNFGQTTAFRPIRNDQGPPPPRHPDDHGPPAPRAPAFTPVNVVSSNGFVPNMEHLTAKMPVSRPLERDSGTGNNINQPHRSQSSLPASSGNNSEGSNDVAKEPAPRSKSTNGIAWAEPQPMNHFGHVFNAVQDAAARHTQPIRPPQSFTPPMTNSAAIAGPMSQNLHVPTYNTFYPNTAPVRSNPSPGFVNTTNAPPPSNFVHFVQQQRDPPSQPQSANTPTHPPPPNAHVQYTPIQYHRPQSTAASPTAIKPPPASFNNSVSTPRHTATPEPTASTPTSHASSVILKFIFELPNRAPDIDNPMPFNELRSFTISQFFDLFCQRSGRDRSKTNHLEFQYNWGYRDSFIVKEFGNEVEWDEIKDRVKDRFLMARERADKRRVSGVGASGGAGGAAKKWQVWVMGPDEEDEEL